MTAPLPRAISLPDRGVIAITGADRVSFLQGLVSNDVAKVDAARAVWAAFLTPQGKWLHDFAIAAVDQSLLLDVEAEQRQDLLKRLKLYRLRSQVELTDETGRWEISALVGSGAAASLGLPTTPGASVAVGGGVAMVDPRHTGLGVRLILPTGALFPVEATPGSLEEWDRTRLALGVPDGARDLVAEKSILLENGFDELNAIDWTKGCYMGQELTARTRYRGLVKKRLVPVAVEGPLPSSGTPVTRAEAEVGEVRSGRNGLALALIRLDAMGDSNADLRAGDARLTIRKPDWAGF